ncbi:MAG: carotenoid oxygenase family protein [Myxococcota bacterium]
MPDYTRIFDDGPETLDETPTDGHGELPSGLSGTFLRNGPGVSHVGDRRLHFLDGYAFVAAARFDGGELHVRGRHVPTPLWLEERPAGTQRVRRAFTNKPGRWSNLLDTKVGNPAGHDVVAWAGAVWACDVGGWFALDPATLERSSRPNVTTKAPAQLGPMPRPDANTGRLVCYRVEPGLRDTVVVEERDATMAVVSTARHALPAAGHALHDAVATERHLVVQSFGKVSVPTLLWGAASVVDAIGMDGAIYVVPRGPSGRVHRIEVPPGQHGFHLFNAYERDGVVVVDAVVYEGRVDFRVLYPPGFPDVPPPGEARGPFPTRFTLDLATGRSEARRLACPPVEAPEVDGRFHGRPHRWGFGPTPADAGDEPTRSGYPWFHGVARVDFEGDAHATWSAGPRVFCSPPAFAPRGDAEGDGWLLTWLLDCERGRTGVAVLDATDVARGPVAARWLTRALPGVSHVSWAPAAATGGAIHTGR